MNKDVVLNNFFDFVVLQNIIEFNKFFKICVYDPKKLQGIQE
jgi:hypothetical protein